LKKALFTCRGRVDTVVGNTIEATVFKNERGDDPKGILLKTSDFKEPGVAEGRWFVYTQFYLGFEVHLLPDTVCTKEDAEAAYRKFLEVLPEEF